AADGGGSNLQTPGEPVVAAHGREPATEACEPQEETRGLGIGAPPASMSHCSSPPPVPPCREAKAPCTRPCACLSGSRSRGRCSSPPTSRRGARSGAPERRPAPCGNRLSDRLFPPPDPAGHSEAERPRARST